MRSSSPAERRYARECALHALYGVEIAKLRPHEALQQAYAVFDQPEIADEIIPKSASEKASAPLTAPLKHFAETLFRGVEDNQEEIDQRLAALVEGYDFDRLAAVDKNVLRIAAYEVFFEPEIPPAVTINEAVEIAKKYSTAESGRFVHGVLGRLIRESPKADWQKPARKSARRDLGEEVYREPPPPVEEHVAEQGSGEAEQISKIGPWRLRSPSESE